MKDHLGRVTHVIIYPLNVSNVKMPQRKRLGIKRVLRISMSHHQNFFDTSIPSHPNIPTTTHGKTAQGAFSHVWSNDHFGKTFDALQFPEVEMFFFGCFFWVQAFWNISWEAIVNPLNMFTLSFEMHILYLYIYGTIDI